MFKLRPREKSWGFPFTSAARSTELKFFRSHRCGAVLSTLLSFALDVSR
jgi:hypothetical protein